MDPVSIKNFPSFKKIAIRFHKMIDNRTYNCPKILSAFVIVLFFILLLK